ncbi:hypothetical protein DL98DRAFT_572945 [Cadophora sp. DSE1049]|nr:hypothetical protein DL98DRAFT_572945 [Cadophora sp. DSE1049]
MLPAGRLREVAPEQPITRRGNSASAPSAVNNTTPRRRKQFSPAERAEVWETRKRGACEDCRRRKVKCKHDPAEAEVSSNLTSGSGSKPSEVSFRTGSAIPQPQGFHPTIISADEIGRLPNGTNSFEEYLSDQVEATFGTAAPKSYSGAAGNFELPSSRPKDREPTQYPPSTIFGVQTMSRQAFPERLPIGYGVNMGSPMAIQAHQSSAVMGYPQVSNQISMAAPNTPVSVAVYQETPSQATQTLHCTSQGPYHRVQVAERRDSGLPQSGSSQPAGNMYQGYSFERSPNPQRSRTQIQSTVPILNPVVKYPDPTVISWVQQQEPRIDHNQKQSYGSPHRISNQQQEPTTSKGSPMPFSNDRLPNASQMQAVPQPFPNHPVATQSMSFQTSSSRPKPATTSFTVPRMSDSHFSTSLSSRPMINGDSELSDRLRARQNMPITPPRQTGLQGQQHGYPQVFQTPRSDPMTYTQPSPQWSSRQNLQQPPSDPRRQKSCEICRRNGSQALGYTCYHLLSNTQALVIRVEVLRPEK